MDTLLQDIFVRPKAHLAPQIVLVIPVHLQHPVGREEQRIQPVQQKGQDQAKEDIYGSHLQDPSNQTTQHGNLAHHENQLQRKNEIGTCCSQNLRQDDAGALEMPDFISIECPEEQDGNDQINKQDHDVPLSKEIPVHHPIEMPRPEPVKHQDNRQRDQAADGFPI